MKKELLKAYLLLVCLLTDVLLYAQPGDTDGTPTDNLEGTDPAATIDAMLLFIVVIAVVFGFYVISKANSKTNRIRS
jgi:hypothetical protein